MSQHVLQLFCSTEFTLHAVQPHTSLCGLNCESFLLWHTKCSLTRSFKIHELLSHQMWLQFFFCDHYFYPSIHFLPLILGSGLSDRRLSRVSWPPSPLRFLLGNPRYIIPPVSSGSTPRGLIPSWTCPENLKRKAPTRHPDQMPEPSSLAPFDEKKQRPYSELPLGALAPHVISQDRIILSASVRESSRA